MKTTKLLLALITATSVVSIHAEMQQVTVRPNVGGTLTITGAPTATTVHVSNINPGNSVLTVDGQKAVEGGTLSLRNGDHKVESGPATKDTVTVTFHW